LRHMNRIKTILYYFFAGFLLLKRVMKVPEAFLTTKNLFIYFDFEREFGGHNTINSDKDLSEILNILDAYDIKTTWFTVGKVFLRYPDSINELVRRGHEIGSHTHAHIVPVNVPAAELKNDFRKFSETASMFNIEISGFHSPNSKWSLKMLNYLRDNNFRYDLIYCSKNQKPDTLLVGRKKRSKIIRLQTIGDDWKVYQKNFTEQEVFNYFRGHLSRIRNGEIAGLGFHPWVLSSDKRIMNGFKQFIYHVALTREFSIKPAKYFADNLMTNVKKQ